MVNRICFQVVKIELESNVGAWAESRDRDLYKAKRDANYKEESSLQIDSLRHIRMLLAKSSRILRRILSLSIALKCHKIK